MKIKKHITLFSLFGIPYIYSCNIQNPIVQTVSSIKPTQNSEQFLISPSPKQSSIFNSSANYNNENLIIRELVGKSNENKQDNDLLNILSNSLRTIAVKENKLYISTYSEIMLSKISLKDLNTEYTYKCSSLEGTSRVYLDSNTKIDELTKSNINILLEHCGHGNYNIKLGKDNKIYIISSAKISQINSDNKIIDIYNFKVEENKGTNSVISIDKNSNIYFASDTSIKKINPKGETIWVRRVIFNKENEYNYIRNMDIDNDENIYFIDIAKQIKKIDKLGKISNLIGGGQNSDFNISPLDYMINEFNIITDNLNNLYLLELNRNRILKYNSQSLKLELFSGNNIPSVNNDKKDASQIYLNKPTFIIFDENNNAYIFDSGNNVLRKIDSKTNLSTVILGNELNRGDGNDLSKASFKGVISIYFKNKNMFISEYDRLRKIDNSNSISTIAGNTQVIPQPTSEPVPSLAPDTIYDNMPSEKSPISYAKILYIDKESKIYISENEKVRVINTDKKISELIDKNYKINSLTQDSKGNIFFASDKIYKLDKNNNISVLAGKESIYKIDRIRGVVPPPSYDNVESIRKNIKIGEKADEIYFLEPRDIIIDNKDNIYAVVTYSYDLFNHLDKYNAIIRINSEGIIDRVYSDINKPQNLTIDSKNNLYFTDKFLHYGSEYNLIKKIDINGKISIYAGRILNDTNFNLIDSLNKIKSRDAVFKDKYFINSITIDNNDKIYFSTNENKIYRIE
ncbi:MAG: hypothetical protein U0354_15105 [Candidatus Sericytochromatia bacterium]